MVRKFLQERAALLARAEALVQVAEREERDFSDAERAEFEALLGTADAPGGQIGALDAKIEQVQGERERLRLAGEKSFAAVPAQKPEAASGAKAMKRAEFTALEPNAQAAFVRGGGRVED